MNASRVYQALGAEGDEQVTEELLEQIELDQGLVVEDRPQGEEELTADDVSVSEGVLRLSAGGAAAMAVGVWEKAVLAVARGRCWGLNGNGPGRRTTLGLQRSQETA